MTHDERRELIERPFPVVRTLPPLPAGGRCVTHWQNGMGAVEGHNRNYEGTAFHVSRVLYGEEYWRW